MTQEKTFLPFFSSSVDTGGGLVVVCMTSFTSMFGVTSYVRLLNCYMGHQHFHTFSLFALNCFTGFLSDGEMSFSLRKETEVGGLHLICDKSCVHSLPGKVLKILK